MVLLNPQARPLKQLLYHLLLLRGPVAQKLFLIAFYGVSISYAYLLCAVCSFPPPNNYSEFSDHMARGMMGPALAVLPLDAITLLCWIAGVIAVIVAVVRNDLREPRCLLLVFLPPAAYFVYGNFYAGIFNGDLRGLHAFLYGMPGF